MDKTKITTVILATVLLSTLLVSAAALITQVNLPATGRVKGIGVSVNPTSITFGDIDVGSVNTQYVVITNTGNKAETLTMATTNLPAYLTLSWNCTNTVLLQSQSVTAAFVLTASPTAPLEPFAFDVTVTGTE